MDCLDLLTGKNYQNFERPDKVPAVKRSQGYKPKTLISMDIPLELTQEAPRKMKRNKNSEMCISKWMKHILPNKKNRYYSHISLLR